MKRRITVILTLGSLLLFGVVAWAQAERLGFVFALGGERLVEQEQTASGAMTFGTDVTIVGELNGDVLLVGGTLYVAGRVEEDIVSIGGDVTLAAGAVIGGSVTMVGGTLVQRDGSTVFGEVRDSRYWERQVQRDIRTLWERTWAHFLITWISLTVFGYLTLHFFRRPLRRMRDTVSSRFGVSIGIGIAGAVVCGPLIALLAVTGVGIPIIYPLVVVYVAAGFLGLVALTLLVERLLSRAFRLSETEGGLLFLFAALVIAAIRAIPYLGPIVLGVAALLGIGAALVTRFGSRAASDTAAGST
jgi:hypothetical protein